MAGVSNLLRTVCSVVVNKGIHRGNHTALRFCTDVVHSHDVGCLLRINALTVRSYGDLFNSYCFIQNVMQNGMFYLTTHSTHFIYGYMASDYA